MTVQLKEAIFRAYGVGTRGGYEIDHLVPLEAGGDNDPANLWPQPATPAPGFREKDMVENWVHDQICKSPGRLAELQQAIATDWTQFVQLARTTRGTPHDQTGDEIDP